MQKRAIAAAAARRLAHGAVALREHPTPILGLELPHGDAVRRLLILHGTDEASDTVLLTTAEFPDSTGGVADVNARTSK